MITIATRIVTAVMLGDAIDVVADVREYVGLEPSEAWAIHTAHTHRPRSACERLFVYREVDLGPGRYRWLGPTPRCVA